MLGVPQKLILLIGLIALVIFGVFAFFTSTATNLVVGGIAWIILLLIAFFLFLFCLFVLVEWKSYPRFKIAFGIILALLVGAIIILGVIYKPFNSSTLNFMYGVGPETDPNLIPPPFPISQEAEDTLNLDQYLPPVMNQGPCNCCWAVSTATVLHARLRKQGVGAPSSSLQNTCNQNNYLVSVQQLLDLQGSGCAPPTLFVGATEFSGYNQAANHNIFSEACVPYYAGGNCNHNCSEPFAGANNTLACFSPNPYTRNSCDTKSGGQAGTPSPQVKVTQVYSISGEDNMKKDLTVNGPITCLLATFQTDGKTKSAWQLSGSGTGLFGDYGNIISPNYIATPAQDGQGYNNNLRTGAHSITVVGYGYAQGIKYWKIQNSWGNWWGNSGFLQIERGVNAWGIETACSAGLVEIV